MFKRIVALVCASLMLLLCCGGALAAQKENDVYQPFAAGYISGSLNPLGGKSYQLYGIIQGDSNETLSIRAVLYKVITNGRTYVTTASNSGLGPKVLATAVVTLDPGTYEIHLYGTTPTHNPAKTITITI